jgi:hypothetical protein
MKEQNGDSPSANRRRFLETAAQGASWLGLGAVLGWTVPRAQAQKPFNVTRDPKRSLGKEFNYDLGSLQKTDPQLLLYRQVRRFSTGLKSLRSLALSPDGQVWAGGDRILANLGPDGSTLKTIPIAAPLQGLAVAPDGKIYAGLTDRVGVFSSAGVLLSTFASLGSKSVVTSIAVTETDIFVADAGQRIIHRLDHSGKVVSRLGKKDAARNIPGLVVPSAYLDVAVGSDGLLWTTNPGRHLLEAYTFEGDLEFSWGEFSNDIKGFCGCCNPVHFTRLSDGRFVTSEKGLPRVKVYSAKGEFECVVAGPEDFPAHLENIRANPGGLDLATGQHDSIYVADPVRGEVLVYEPRKTAT